MMLEPEEDPKKKVKVNPDEEDEAAVDDEEDDIALDIEQNKAQDDETIE